jgi:hypothetical protein
VVRSTVVQYGRSIKKFADESHPSRILD